ncbi:hypothetical protein JB92DRAFT_2959156 [Gautieria morchelliformis]|nr:hypothetical protein JB92DRAFT_2959156 [Gautieria morchelliformis]
MLLACKRGTSSIVSQKEVTSTCETKVLEVILIAFGPADSQGAVLVAIRDQSDAGAGASGRYATMMQNTSLTRSTALNLATPKGTVSRNPCMHHDC